MARTVRIDAASITAGGAFVPDRDFAINDECTLLVCGTSGQLEVTARVVYVDPVRGTGLEVLGYGALREQLAALALTAPRTATRDRDEDDDDPRPSSIHMRIRGLNLAQQVKLAHDGDLQERRILERIYGKNVWEPLLRNPRLTAPEIARIAKMGTLPRILVDVIVGNGTWLQMPDVRRALLLNPRLAVDQIVKILRMMPKPELRLVPTQTVLPHAVREAARRLLRGEAG